MARIMISRNVIADAEIGRRPGAARPRNTLYWGTEPLHIGGRSRFLHFSFEPCGSGDIETPAFRGGGQAVAERGYGGIGRHARFRFWCRKAWEFKSLYPHQIDEVPGVQRRNATGPAGAGPADNPRAG